eukprot:TRINITY_DN16433_c0_g1_i2.p1 TRINITY_DN16433_c0_g1~~TRINITY_DN16433_c0_g1_i2.p1  ORF type:complete len:141 (+),score=0.89 TRINITY_DN16433_c0_g1_i2:120-542(+)
MSGLLERCCRLRVSPTAFLAGTPCFTQATVRSCDALHGHIREASERALGDGRGVAPQTRIFEVSMSPTISFCSICLSLEKISQRFAGKMCLFRSYHLRSTILPAWESSRCTLTSEMRRSSLTSKLNKGPVWSFCFRGNKN